MDTPVAPLKRRTKWKFQWMRYETVRKYPRIHLTVTTTTLEDGTVEAIRHRKIIEDVEETISDWMVIPKTPRIYE